VKACFSFDLSTFPNCAIAIEDDVCGRCEITYVGVIDPDTS